VAAYWLARGGIVGNVIIEAGEATAI